MRFSHLHSPAEDPTPRLAAMVTGGAIFLDEVMENAPETLQELILGGDAELARVKSTVEVAVRSGVSPTPEEEFRFAPAVLAPPAIMAVGLNYVDHVEEMDMALDAEPTIFGFWNSSLGAHEGTVTWSPQQTQMVDYEVELGVVIGRDGKDLPAAEALDYVWGYTVVNDISARDIQFSTPQWIRAKSLDGFTPVGPWVVTADELGDPQNLAVSLTLNGVELQNGHTSLMMRGVAEIIEHLSEGTTLKAGTLISTGTPAGIGYSRDPQVFMHDGDTVVATVQGIGSLITHCAESSS
ncbi:MAG: hypothetical protein RIR88_195 [Actinomycetota bacterium]